jgi:hypothetical protein
MSMAQYCSVCGDELEPEEEQDGICESCKLAQGETPSSDEHEAEAP